MRVLTDPVLRRRPGLLRTVAREVDPRTARELDLVLLSHLHRDHCDPPSLLRLAATTVIVPEGAGRRLRRLGFAAVEELPVGGSIRVGQVSVRATPAVHGRGPRAGFVLEGSSRVYFAGDTDLFPEMVELAPLDVALLPVWGWGPTLGAGHLDPLRAAQALGLLRPRVAVPIHWGTLHPLGLGWLRPGYLRRPPLEFAEHARRLAPDVEVVVLQPGESTRLT